MEPTQLSHEWGVMCAEDENAGGFQEPFLL